MIMLTIIMIMIIMIVIITVIKCRWRLGVVSLTALTDAGVYVSVDVIIALTIVIIINIIVKAIDMSYFSSVSINHLI